MARLVIAFLVWMIASASSVAQTFPKGFQLEKDPWTKAELMEPSALAAILRNPKAAKPIIFNIGVVENIKGAKNIGAASEKENLARLKSALAKLPKNSPIVIYCGCCPFANCPNIRPAFKALKTGGYTNARLLNLKTNIKTDWISKGYPM